MEGKIEDSELQSDKFCFKQFCRLNYWSIKLIGFRSKPLKSPVGAAPYIRVTLHYVYRYVYIV